MSVNQKTVAEQVVDKLLAGKENKADKILSLVPEGHSPKVYLDLVKTQVLGTDKQGQPRPTEDLLFFLYSAKRTGLDPLVNQIYAVYRWDTRLGREKMTIQTGIDGMRLVAQRQGDYAGQDEVKYIPENEETQYPVKATVTVYKMVKGARVGFTASARWGEYVQLNKDGKVTGLWAKMPYLMLGKCAESLALRKAFPNELSGLYTSEEMGQAGNVLADLPTPERFKKGEIKVEHGKPVDIGTPETAKVTKKAKAKKVDKKVVNKVEPRSVADMRKQLLEKAKTARETEIAPDEAEEILTGEEKPKAEQQKLGGK